MNAVAVFLLNLLATWYLVGLIWMVQIVHYNLMDRVGSDQFVRYETDHNRLITPIVGVPMLVEITTAAALLFYAPPGLPRWAIVMGLILVVMIWVSTALIQVPLHTRLLQGFSDSAYRQLVSTNWIRTVLWSVRGVLVGWLAWSMLQRAT